MGRNESENPRRRGPHGWGAVLFGLLLAASVAPGTAHAQTGADSVTVTWRSVGDDSLSGTATAYDLRYSTEPITAATWDAAVQAPGEPTPRTPGTRQNVIVRGLQRGTTYWFAIKTVDDAGNWSGISNIARWEWIYDTAPPAAPAGVTAAMLEDGSVRVRWSPNSETDLAGYNVYRATAAAGPFALVNITLVTSAEFVDSDPPAGATTIWYQVSAKDGAGNESARSSSATATDGGSVAAAESWSAEPPYPNPSRAGSPINIPIVAPGAGGQAVVEIVTAAGQRVRRIDLGSLSAGPTLVQWDGRNDAGREVAPGPYTAWLISGSARVSVRLVRVP